MSVKVAVYKKLPSAHEYAASELEIKKWAKGFTDLRIEFGSRKSFSFDARCHHKPKIQGIIVASAVIDRQLKPALFFYPIPAVRYPESARIQFQERILGDLREWLEMQFSKQVAEIVGYESILIELNGTEFKEHRLRYL